MAGLIQTSRAGRVAIVTIDNPPVNALTLAAWEAIGHEVAAAAADPDVEAIVLRGAGSTFVAGADISSFKALTTRDQALARSGTVHALLLRIEDAPKPVVAAMHGHALGGGLELGLACHYRVASPTARLGQPEVLLGLIPGAGGTQRLPRLCGVELALTLCTGATPIDAPTARAAGLVDAVIEGDLTAGAVAFARARAAEGPPQKTRAIELGAEARRRGIDACERLRGSLVVPGGISAPFAAIAAIEGTLTLNFHAGSIRERELFADCVVSLESRALRHLFFAEREAAKIPGVPADTPALEIRRAAVVGAGTMGGGIAMCYANAGIPVLLKETNEAALQRGLGVIRANYESSAARGRLTREEVEARLARITPTTSYAGFEHVDIVVEAAFEDLDVKRQIFRELGTVTASPCVLASNTSTLDIDALAAVSGRPAQVVGHHFFSPANVMKLLEVVRGRHTSPAVLATSVAIGKRLGKAPVTVRNGFGFVANRMLGPYLREAHQLLEEGAHVSQVDRALVDFGMPVGPFAMEDIAGIDVGARIRRERAALGGQWADGPQSPLPDRLFALGRYGQKTGAGWYRYEPGSRTPHPDPLIEALAREAAAARGLPRRPVDDEAIVLRLLSALVNEGFKLVEEGLAARAGDIDVIYCHGFGFPRYRGGPMFWADAVGPPVLLERIRRYRERLGAQWAPAPLLERLAAEGRSLYDE